MWRGMCVVCVQCVCVVCVYGVCLFSVKCVLRDFVYSVGVVFVLSVCVCV